MKAWLALLLTTVAAFAQPATPQDPAFVANANYRAASGGSTTPEILWVKMNEGSGTTAAAAVGTGMTTVTDWSSGTQSGSGSCMSFVRANSDHAENTGSVTYGNNVVTVMFWVYHTAWPTGGSTERLIESVNNPDCVDGAYKVFYDFSSIQVYLIGTGCSQIHLNSASGLSNSTWHHLAFVLDGSSAAGNIKLYVDGSITADAPAGSHSGTPNFTANILNLGYKQQGPDSYFNGRMDDLRIYSGEKDATFISTVYAAGAQ